MQHAVVQTYIAIGREIGKAAGEFGIIRGRVLTVISAV